MKAKQTQTKKQTTTRAKVGKSTSSRAPARAVKKAPLHVRVRGHAKKVLVPHKENQYRPHLIRLHGIIAVLVVALIAQASYSFFSTGHFSVLGQVSNIQTPELLIDTNNERAVEGIANLQINDKLSEAAFLKAQDMFAQQYWAHTSPTGVEPWKWFGDVGYNYSFAGENLAKNYPTADATVEAWMNSPTHRENLLNKEYTDVGFAVVDGELDGENTTLVVALYGAPVTVATVSAVVAENTGFSAPAVAGDAKTPLAYFGSALEALSPVTIAILGVFAVVAIVGVAAHHYRKSLPKAWKRSWRVHHGMYTFVGMLVLGLLVVIATAGSGRI